MHLTDAFLTKQNLLAADYNDNSVAGLTLRIGKKRRTWTLRFRDRSGKYVREPLGYYSPGSPTHVGIAEARRKARDTLDRIAVGVPVTAQPVVKPADAPTLQVLCDRYEKARLASSHQVKTFKHSMKCIRIGLADYLDLPARSFTRADLRACRDSMAENGRTWGNRFLSYASGMFSWAVENDLVEHNYCRDLKREPEKVRDRVLSLDELAAIWNAADRLGDGPTRASYGRMVRLLVLTGARLGEAVSLRHGDVLGHIWKQTANKSSRPHRLPLPKQALALIGSGSARDLAFPSSAGTRLVDHGKRKEEFDAASGVENWVVHDIRRSFATHLLEAGTNPMVVDILLNHSQKGVWKNYFHATLEKEKAEALQNWADLIDAALSRARVPA